MRLCASVGSLMALAIPGFLTAQQPQEPQAPPPMVAVSYYECTGTPADVDQLLEAVWQPVVEQQVREGKLLGWGILRHAWSDEWNLVMYRTIADLRALQASQEVLGPALNQRDAEYGAKLARLCPRHKDNIYWLTASGPAVPTP